MVAYIWPGTTSNVPWSVKQASAKISLAHPPNPASHTTVSKHFLSAPATTPFQFFRIIFSLEETKAPSRAFRGGLSVKVENRVGI
jgi:hypothetical protein